MSMQAKTDYLSYGYAGIVALGGVTGYLKAGLKFCIYYINKHGCKLHTMFKTIEELKGNIC